ncbi:Rieske (2Fe-2S) protein [Actinosynnema pretiosum subsp. pretiosum]|uniref:Rieske (2Fe-2S) protein n=1 Tax=Actinosynnema pretiosum subsp. pretiosum TaxID=103721 RepID=A0AA45L5D6_9PSEU|nr:Rieske(2Fe-2S) domain-containing protein [Actinosynnema pretiosum subsp. pretiosum]QUF03485.1 Rieske (2Fe-2S) protein [Actinosynnema pretiosum subsp. pretiosum]
MTTTDPGPLSRRRVLCGVLVALAVPGGLAACGDGGSSSSAPTTGSTGTGGGATTGGASTPATSATGGSATSGGQSLVALADVPDNGGVVVDGPKGKPLVLVRTGGEVKAYDATCPHVGETVGAPKDGAITCPAHGSRFDASTGEVTNPPAQRGLTAVQVAVQGDQVVYVGP